MADASLVGVGGVTCALSVVFGWIAIKVQIDHRRWCARGVRAEGVVTRLAERRGHPNLSEDAVGTPTDTAFGTVPIVGFTAANGQRYEIDAPEAPSEIGTLVEVAYDPVLPSNARAVARTPKVGCAVVLFVIGLFLVIAGIGW